MAMRIITLAALVLAAILPVTAQLAAPNDSGVAMGHVHLTVRNVEAQTHFWVDIMGGKLVRNQRLDMIEFPGIFILLRPGDPSGPPAGSVVDHFGFVVKDWPGWLAKWHASGLKVEQTGTNPNQSYVTAPDGIRVEMFGDPDLPVPVQMNHIHFFLPKGELPEMKAWYAKMFGGTPGRRDSVARPGNWIETDDLPGVNLSFGVSEERRAPTVGRAIDHIGFEVKNIAEFAEKLEAQGVKFDQAPRPSQNTTATKVAFLTDPWGTRIELTEGLPPAVH